MRANVQMYGCGINSEITGYFLLRYVVKASHFSKGGITFSVSQLLVPRYT